jgi:hypothetical protein
MVPHESHEPTSSPKTFRGGHQQDFQKNQHRTASLVYDLYSTAWSIAKAVEAQITRSVLLPAPGGSAESAFAGEPTVYSTVSSAQPLEEATQQA